MTDIKTINLGKYFLFFVSQIRDSREEPAVAILHLTPELATTYAAMCKVAESAKAGISGDDFLHISYADAHIHWIYDYREVKDLITPFMQGIDPDFDFDLHGYDEYPGPIDIDVELANALIAKWKCPDKGSGVYVDDTAIIFNCHAYECETGYLPLETIKDISAHNCHHEYEWWQSSVNPIMIRPKGEASWFSLPYRIEGREWAIDRGITPHYDHYCVFYDNNAHDIAVASGRVPYGPISGLNGNILTEIPEPDA